MSKKYILFLIPVLVLALLLGGCGRNSDLPPETTPAETTPAATTPPDGNPGDVTCKGSYSAEDWTPNAAVASVGDHTLTNEQLLVWYRMAVAERMQDHWDAAPDFSRPLDTQKCPIDESVNSWQQYFLKRALNTWHSVCALELQAREQSLPMEEAYQPNLDNHEKYMTGMPATEYLYGYSPLFQPNSMHDAYLTALPETLEALAAEKGLDSLEALASAMGVSADVLTETVRMYNYSYMYFTTLSYYIESAEEDVLSWIEAEGRASGTGRTVDIRHILLSTEEEAQDLLKYWERKTRHNESAFADLAYKNTLDHGTAADGGACRNLLQGQLPEVLDVWAFDPERQPEDTAIIQSEFGWHLLFFVSGTDLSYARAEEDLTLQNLEELISLARQRYPAEVDYSAITLTDGEALLSGTDVLYPDISHERFPEVPLYLQQDYPHTMYGGFRITTNGCGITSMAMLASYLADDELTPPEMCARFGRYSHSNGTDGMIFTYEPAGMGFFLREKTYDTNVAKAALEEGQIVISVQHQGYWTRGGHYIVLEKIDEDGMIQVRDSNIYNYNRVKAHVEDRHTWKNIVNAGSGYWIFEDKVTSIPACCRCGTPDDISSGILTADYICSKCIPALQRRNTYLQICGQDTAN